MTKPRPTAPRSELSKLQERLNKLLEQALVGGGGGMPPGGPQALSGWKPLFDLGFNPAKPFDYNQGTIPKILEGVVADSETRVLQKMYDKTGPVDVNGLRAYRDNSLRGDKKFTLSPFVSDPKLTLTKKN